MAKRTTTAVASAATQTVTHGPARLLVYAPPWCVWLALPLLGGGAYLLWGRDPHAAPWFSMVAFAQVIALAGFTWHVMRIRGEVVRWLACASVVLAGMWFIVAGLLGPFTRVIIDGWGFLGFGVCIFWTVRRVSMTPDPQQGDGGGSKLERVLAGARVRNAREIEGRVVASVEVNRGEQTVGDLQRSSEQLAGVLGVRAGAVRFAPANREDAGLTKLTIVPRDPLDESVTWPGPSAPGKSIAVPIPCGPYEDGVTGAIRLAGDGSDGSDVTQWLWMGINGSGKTQFGCMVFTDALTRKHFVLIGCDTRKARQTFGPLWDHMYRVADTKAKAKAMTAGIVRAIRYRAQKMGELGIRKWTPGCGFPVLCAWYEEASEIAGDSKTLTTVTEAGRSVGIFVVIAMQRASHTNMETDTRAQLTGTVCFGVRDGIDATFALRDDVMDAGATPDAWGNTKPGYHYLVAPGVPEDRLAMPLRSYRAVDEQLAAALSEWAHVRDVLDEGTAEALGPEPATSPSTDLEPTVANETNLFTASDDDELEPMPTEPDAHIPVDPDEPIGPAPVSMQFTAPANGKKLTTEQARAVVQRHLRTLLEQGRSHTKAADVCQMKPATTRTREWVRQELGRLCTEPGPGDIALEKDLDSDELGVFRILDPVPAGAGA